MVKKLLQNLMLIAMLLIGSHAFAHDFEVDGIYYNILSETDETVEVTFQGYYYNSFDYEYYSSVTIPQKAIYNNKTYSVTSIGERAFYYCSGLTEIYCKATTPPTTNRASIFSYNVCRYATLYVPKGCKSEYESVDPWRNFLNIKEMDFSGVESTFADDVNVLIENGNIVINGADNAKVEVYNVNGQCVYNGTATTIPVTAKGLYIVKVNGKSFKVML